MNRLHKLLDSNHAWAKRINREDPGFFEQLSKQQAPEYLWIGCSDSRVPANQVVDLAPGEVFVHRNIANVVVHTDLNCLSVMQYAVDVLEVKHVLVVGHYGCGGVAAALHKSKVGLCDNWIRHVGDVAQKHQALLDTLPEARRYDALCELNAIEQAENVCHTTVIRDAWERGQTIAVHAWVYGLADGKVNELGMNVISAESLPEVYARAIAGVCERHGACP